MSVLNQAVSMTPDNAGSERHWADYFMPALYATATGIVGFLYILLGARLIGVSGKNLDLVLAFSVVLPLPMLFAWLPVILRAKIADRTSRIVQTVTNWTAVTVLIVLSGLSPLLSLAQYAPEEWHKFALQAAYVLLALHAMLIAHLCCLRSWLPAGSRWLWRDDIQVAALATVLCVATLALFRIDGENWSVYSAVGALFQDQYPDRAGSISWFPAFIAGLVLVLAVWGLGALEIRLIQNASPILPLVRRLALALAVLMVIPVYSELSLGGDTFHYLTNMAPALHLMHGGTLMGDTFSQYGPGPIMATALGFLLGGKTFGAANMVVQFHNLAFTAVWLICLYRISSLKLSAILLGFISIGVIIAGWAYGMQSINVAPSILGLRYLPLLLMVLAISCLPLGSRQSVFTILATALTGVWSIEVFAGAVAVHVAVIGLLDLKRRPGQFLRNMALALAPLALSVVVLASVAGRLPDYGMYFQFLRIYNPVSEYWSIPTAPVFFGWAPIAVSIFLVSAAAWQYLRAGSAYILPISSQVLVYRLVPMAVLTAAMSLYYVGRSVDYTLIIAGLPFLGLALPALIGSVRTLVSRRGPQRLLVLLPVAIALSITTFSLQTLFRQDAPYRIALNDCLTMSICSPAKLWSNLRIKAAGRPMMEHVGDYFGDRYFGQDSGMVTETVEALNAYADGPYATVLLGTLGAYDFLSEIAYLHSGKWDRWPRSFTFSDQLVPSLEQSILKAPVVMQEGDLLVVNRDRSKLGSLETGILERVNSQGELCPEPGKFNAVDVYRFSGFACQQYSRANR